MHPPTDGPRRPEADDGPHPPGDPADEDLERSGPGDGDAGGADQRRLPDHPLPGGVDHTTAAVGAGGIGLVLLGIRGAIKRRQDRRRRMSLDE